MSTSLGARFSRGVLRNNIAGIVMPPSLPASIHGANHQGSDGPLAADALEAGADGLLLALLDWGEFGARPLRVDDELERIELLVLLPQPVKRLTAQGRQGLAHGVGEEPQVAEFERERIIAPIQQDLRAADEGLFLLSAE